MTSIETSGIRPQAEFGFDDVRAIPLAAIINLRQMRETVDPDELEKLKGRIPYHMDEDGVLRFDLTHPIMVNVLDREGLEQYVVDHDEYYQEPSGINLDTLPNLDGLYLVRIVGHMRGAVALESCMELGVDPREAVISASLKYDLPFIEANRLQNIENTHVTIRPVEDAHSVQRHYLWLQRHGQPTSPRVLARYFGYSEDKIRAALRFVQAPTDIQGFVGNGLSYGNVVSLVMLRETYEQALARREESVGLDVRELAEQRVRDFFEISLRGKLRGTESVRIGELIKAKIAEVQKSATYYTEELFVVDLERERGAARTRIRRELGDVALQVLEYLQHHDVLSDEQRQKLARLLSPMSETAEPETPLF